MSSGGKPSSSCGGGGPCGACKFLRRKCVAGCIFAPYFDSEQGATQFAAVHKVFGASNVSKLLIHVPQHKRADAVVCICFEAQARLRDPIYGSVAHIVSLQQQVANMQAEISYLRLQSHLASLELPQAQAQAQAPPGQSQSETTTSGSPAPLSISDLPTMAPIPSSVGSVYDLSSIFETSVSASWGMEQQQARPSDHIFGVPSASNIVGGPGTGTGTDHLHPLPPQLFQAGQVSAQAPPGTTTSSLIKRE